MEKVEPGGLLDARRHRRGPRRACWPASGVSLDWDTRDAVLFPRRGTFLQLSADAYGAMAGSDFTFSRLKLDLRRVPARRARPGPRPPGLSPVDRRRSPRSTSWPCSAANRSCAATTRAASATRGCCWSRPNTGSSSRNGSASSASPVWPTSSRGSRTSSRGSIKYSARHRPPLCRQQARRRRPCAWTWPGAGPASAFTSRPRKRSEASVPATSSAPTCSAGSGRP